MDRRSFLLGIGATAVIAKIPERVLEMRSFPDWETEITKIMIEYYNNMIIYGQCLIEYIPVWPYIKIIPPGDWMLYTAKGGLFE